MPALILALAGLGLLAWQLDRTQLREDRAFYAGWRAESHIVTGFCRLIDSENQVRLRGFGGDCEAALAAAKANGEIEAKSGHLVVLLHGLGRSRRIFAAMEEELRAAGYETVAMAYPSLTRGVAEHAAQLEARLNEQGGVTRVSFVTHSLGALVLRETLVRDGAWRARIDLGRAVLLAAPNRGSELARALDGVKPFHLFGGPSASQIAAGAAFAPFPEDFAFGVIAGGRGDRRGYNPFLSADNDGVVTVEETQLDGARDFRRLPVLHSFIASDPETIEATLNFLARGRFSAPS